VGAIVFLPFKSREFAEEGFTLIELLVYMSLATVVLVIVGGFMINSLKVERDVTRAAAATSAAQLVSTSVQAAVRNGSGARVETAPNGDQMLVARTAPIGESGAYVCRAWFYDAAATSLFTKASTGTVAIAWPSSSPAGSWTLLGSGIKGIGASTRVFEPAVDAGPAGRGVGPSSDFVSMNFEVAAGSRAPVRIETTVHTRIESIVGVPCFA
jgi:type II secretory pathway pseudopilin PulG